MASQKYPSTISNNQDKNIYFPLKSNTKALSYVSGFTLIELLSTIVIVGILSAIALPAFLAQTNKARETEAKISLNTIKKNQYAFYIENNSFSGDLEKLNFTTPETQDYRYTVQSYPTLQGRIHLALSKNKGLRSYGAVVYFQETQLTECSLFSMDISLEDSPAAIFGFILNAIENSEQFCP